MRKGYYSYNSYFLFFFFIFISASSVKATDFVFTGTGNYTDAALWTPSYPTGQILVGNTVTISAGSVCTIPAGTFIFIKGEFINNGDLTTNNVMGAFTGGTIINNGYWHGISNIDNLGSIINNGTIEAEGTFSTQGEGQMINAAGATIINKAGFIASSVTGGTFEFSGTFRGGGSINVPNYPNQGTIAPGFSPGVLTFKQNLTLNNSGTLEIEIAGNGGAGAMNGHDQINVEQPGGGVGNIDIGGTLQVELLNGFVPVVGEEWIIATGTTIGSFSNLDLPSAYIWEVDIQTSIIIIRVLDSSLPVSLINFYGNQQDNLIRLNWNTAEEIQNELWQIEHLINDNQWRAIGQIAGAGFSNINRAYLFDDLNPNEGDNYYRLVQIDFDGGRSISPAINVNFRKGSSNIFVYPNPADQVLYFSQETSSARLYKLTGELVLNENNSGLTIHLNKLISGPYLLQYTADGKVSQELILIKH